MKNKKQVNDNLRTSNRSKNQSWFLLPPTEAVETRKFCILLVLGETEPLTEHGKFWISWQGNIFEERNPENFFGLSSFLEMWFRTMDLASTRLSLFTRNRPDGTVPTGIDGTISITDNIPIRSALVLSRETLHKKPHLSKHFSTGSRLNWTERRGKKTHRQWVQILCVLVGRWFSLVQTIWIAKYGID